MRKFLILSLALFLVAFAVSADAGTLTVGKTDLTLVGAVTGTWGYLSDRQDSDAWELDNAVLHLFKNPTVEAPVGGHLAFGNFAVKAVNGAEVDPQINDDNFRAWLAYFSWMPAAALQVDVGLLWHKFGEPPVSILNPHITRPVAFLAQPVLYEGGRISYNAGVVDVYVGMNDGSELGAGHGNVGDRNPLSDVTSEWAFEVGATAHLGTESVDLGLHYFDNDKGFNNLMALIGTKHGMFDARIEANFFNDDDLNIVGGGTDDTATTYALYASAKLSDTFKLPLRIEIVDDNDSLILRGINGWNVAITPTFKPSKNSFIRLEGVYASDDNNVYADSDGNEFTEDSRTSLYAEFGFLY